MNETGWMTIPVKLRDAGFAVFYNRISYSSTEPLWRASATRGGHEWNGTGRDLETALVELEGQTKDAVKDRPARMPEPKLAGAPGSR